MKITTFPLILLLLFASCTRNNDNAQPESIYTLEFWTSIRDLPIDSLLKLADTFPQDTNLARLYNKIGGDYKSRLDDNEKQKEYFLKGKALSEKWNWDRGLIFFARNYYNLVSPDTGIIILQEAIQLAKNDQFLIAKIYTEMGTCYFAMSWYETALQYFHEAVTIFEKLDEKGWMAYVYGLMAGLHNRTHIYHDILTYSEKALDILKDEPNNPTRVTILVNRSLGFRGLNELDEAENCLTECLRIAAANHTENGLLKIYGNLTHIALRRFDLEKAEMYSAKTMEQSLRHKHMESSYYANEVYAFVELYKGNFGKSEEYAREALKIGIELIKSPGYQLEPYTILKDLAIARHDFKKEIFYKSKVDSIENIVTREKTIASAKEMEAKYETEKKVLEIEQQKSVIARANMQRWLLAAGIAIFAIIIVLLWYMLRLRNRSNRTLDERNHALDEMNATKDKFFSIISHDLKNPAVAQRDALRILFDQAAQWDAASLHDYYGKLLRSADSHVELLYELLGWAQLQTKRMSCEPKPFDFEREFRSDLALTGKMAEDKGVGMVAEIPPDAIITADAGMITTVVRNLLTNAVKFTSSGGTVTLSVIAAPNGKYTVSVTDTGVGMTDEERQNIFRLDRQHNRCGTSGEPGTGLGLIVCREFLIKHGSELRIESEEGKGSRFWFEL